MDHGVAIRNIVRRELSLQEPRPSAPRPARKRAAALFRVTAAAALLCGISASTAWAQAPYRQEVIPGFSSLDVGWYSNPELVDLDADGDLDAVVGETQGTLRYFENIGTSSSPVFGEATGAANPLSGIDVGLLSSPDLVDLDADGDLDAIVGAASGILRYFENVGTSTNPVFEEITGSNNPFDGFDDLPYSSPELVDLDADGDLDAIVGDWYGSLRYFVNTGTTASPAFVEAGSSANPLYGIGGGDNSNPELVDLDGDGDLDAIVGEYYGNLWYYENTGTSTTPAFAADTYGANPLHGIDVGYLSDPELVDLDADDDLDAIVGDWYGSLRYFVNTGTSTSPALVEATGAANPFSGVSLAPNSSPELVDLDADGDLDAIVGGNTGTLQYLVNTGTSTSPVFVAVFGALNPFSDIQVGYHCNSDLVDLDADGDLDAIVGGSDGLLRYVANTGTSTSPAFVEATGSANPFSGIDVGQGSSPELVDLDADGDLDAVVGEYSGSVRYYENTGTSSNPAFVEATGGANPFSGVYLLTGASPDLVDLDGDGDLDAIVGEYGGCLVLYRSLAVVFLDGFEDGGTSAWSLTVQTP